MRAVLVHELTRLQFEVAREGTEDSVRRNYEEDVFNADLKVPHVTYQSELKSVRQHISREGQSVVDCLRHEAQGFIFRDDDIVVILGDDGAFVNVAKLLNEQRVITISTKTKHCGRLMKFTAETFASSAKVLLSGKSEHLAVSIARAETSLGHKLEAVNDFFVGRADLRSSRYAIWSEDEFVDQVSSGVIVSTGTGSTGWEHSARLHDPDYEEREPDDDSLAVVTRELCHGEVLGVIDGVDDAQFRSNDNDTRVIADGVLSDFAMLRLPAGATVTITANVRAIRLCV